MPVRPRSLRALRRPQRTRQPVLRVSRSLQMRDFASAFFSNNGVLAGTIFSPAVLDVSAVASASASATGASAVADASAVVDAAGVWQDVSGGATAVAQIVNDGTIRALSNGIANAVASATGVGFVSAAANAFVTADNSGVWQSVDAVTLAQAFITNAGELNLDAVGLAGAIGSATGDGGHGRSRIRSGA